MESPWRRTFSSVFVILCVNNVYVNSQNVAAPQFAQGPYPPQLMNTPPFPPNGIYPDVLPPGRAFPEAIVQQPGPTEPVSGFNSQRLSIPPVSQLLLNLPKPNIAPLPPPGVFTDPCHPNISPPQPVPNIVLPPPYLYPNPLIPLPPSNGPYPQNYGLPPGPQILPGPFPIPSQGQFIPNPGPNFQEQLPQREFNLELSNPNLITFNSPPPVFPPSNHYSPNGAPLIPGIPPPPMVPLTAQLVPPFSDPNILQFQGYSTTPQNFGDMTANDFNYLPPFGQFVPNENIPILPPSPLMAPPGLGFQFIPNARISGPVQQIQMLPPAIPPFSDTNFAPQQFYIDPNNIPPFLPPPFYPEPYNLSPTLPPPIYLPESYLPNIQAIFPPPNSLPPPIPISLLAAPSNYPFPQGSLNSPNFPNQQALPPYNYQFPPDLGIQTQYQLNTLPTVIPAQTVPIHSYEDNGLPINLQINVPATNMPPPYITIISTAPPSHTATVLETPESDSEYPFGNFLPFPTYPPPPIIIQGSKSKRKKWIPILIALFASSGCCGGCGGGSCGSSNNIPIPYPIAVPTNNPIVVNKKKSHSKVKLDDTTDEE